MSSDYKYNVIFMRDDRPVRRFRISPFWLRLLFWIFLLALTACAAASWYSYQLWKGQARLSQNIIRKTEANQKLAQEVERLKNIEKLLTESHNATLQPLPLLTTAVTEEPPTLLDLESIFAFKDLKQISVSNVQVEMDSSEFMISFDLNSLMGRQVIKGYIKAEIITKKGRILPLITSEEPARFEISNYKKVDIVTSLPDQLDQNQAFALKLTITNYDGTIIFCDTYTLSRIIV